MINILYWVLFAASLLIIYIYHKEGAFSGINFFSILLTLFIVYCLSSSLLVKVGFFDGFYFLIPIQNKTDVIQIGSVLQIWSIFGILITIYFLDKKLKTKVLFFSIFQFKESILLRHKIFISLLLLSFIISSVIYAYQAYPSIPTLLSTGASPIDIAKRRLELTRDYNGNGYIKTASINLSLVTTFILGLMIQQRKRNLIILFPLLALALMTCLSTGEKSFFVLWFIYFYLGFSFFKNKILNIWLIISVGTLAAFTYLVQFGLSMESINHFFERIFLAQGIAVYLSVDQYLNGANLIHFDSMASPLTSFLISDNGSTRAASDAYVDIYYPGMRELGTWNVNGLYIHEALANFGLFVAVISPFVIGGLIYFVLLFIKTNRKSPALIIFYIFFMLNFLPFLTSYNRLIFNTETILMVLVFLSIEFMSNIFKKSISEKTKIVASGDTK